MSIVFDETITKPSLDLAIRLVRTPGEFSAVLELRRRVFGLEQDMIAGNASDQDDRRSHLVVALIRDGAIGTARLSPPTVDRPEAHISWVAVLPSYRGRGTGSALMRALLDIADEAIMPMITLSAQTHALPFYQRFGFIPYGHRFTVRGIEHQAMVRHRP
jgi:predicted GNAT family N-acyltransferase